MAATNVNTRNIVIIGDGTVGKTCLAHSYSNDTFLESYVPTVYDKEIFELTLNGILYSVKLIDTAGQEEYDRVRKLFYKEADCFILCYSVDNRASFENILHKWMPELKSNERWPIAVILTATKTDLRKTSRKVLITTLEGEDMARKIYANRFIECSAKENVGIQSVIEEAVRASVRGPIRQEDQTNERSLICTSCCQS